MSEGKRDPLIVTVPSTIVRVKLQFAEEEVVFLKARLAESAAVYEKLLTAHSTFLRNVDKQLDAVKELADSLIEQNEKLRERIRQLESIV